MLEVSDGKSVFFRLDDLDTLEITAFRTHPVGPDHGPAVGTGCKGWGFQMDMPASMIPLAAGSFVFWDCHINSSLRIIEQRLGFFKHSKRIA